MRQCAKCQTGTSNPILCDSCSVGVIKVEDMKTWSDDDLRRFRTGINTAPHLVKGPREIAILDYINEKLKQ